MAIENPRRRPGSGGPRPGGQDAPVLAAMERELERDRTLRRLSRRLGRGPGADLRVPVALLAAAMLVVGLLGAVAGRPPVALGSLLATVALGLSALARRPRLLYGRAQPPLAARSRR